LVKTAVKVKGSQKENGIPIQKVNTTPTLLVVRVKANPRDMVVATLGITTLLLGINLIITTHLGIVMILLRGTLPRRICAIFSPGIRSGPLGLPHAFYVFFFFFNAKCICNLALP
jgi:hypothetical protein